MNGISSQKPNLFIVGMPRSGTTSLYLYLKQHPQVYLSILKEPHYFGRDLPDLYSYVRSINEYSSLFSGVGNEKIIGEGSVWYLESQSAIDEIYQHNPHAKLIIALRSPLDMLLSLHSLYLRTGNEDVLDFYKAFNLQDKREKGGFLPKDCYYRHGLSYREIGLYSKKVKRAFDLFGREKVQVIVFDDLVNYPDKTYQRLLKFLNLDSFSPFFEKKEAEEAIRNKVLAQLKVTSNEVKRKIRQKRIYLHEKTTNHSLTNQHREEILNYFKDDIVETGKLINVSLENWIQPS